VAALSAAAIHEVSMKKLALPTKIAIGMVIGVLLGAVVGESITVIQPIGDLFLRLIRMVVVPLVFASLLVGTATVGDPKKLGRIGGRTMAYYLCTTAIAITIGLLIANVVQPGAGMDPIVQDRLLADFGTGAESSVETMRARPSVTDTLLDIVPQNPIEALATANMLQIIFFAVMFGVALTLVPNAENKAAVLSFFEGVSDAMIKLVHVIMLIAPVGVLALMAVAVGQFGLDVLRVLMLYAACVVAGLLIHMSLVYTVAVRVFAKISPRRFFAAIRPAQLVAFSTSSSGAALPVTMDRVTKGLGVPEQVSSFVLPLGATINMDGTALYQGVATVFIAQVYGVELGLSGQLTIVLMATLASIGAAAVPGVGIITLAMVLEQLGLPLDGIALILGVDRVLDMLRTATNVTGDASAAVIVAAAEGQLGEGEELGESA
jgi:Na+/H+-dicarboxylate symporter